MGLVLNPKSGKTAEIDQTHDVFQGTPFAASGSEFKIVLASMTNARRAMLRQQFTRIKKGIEHMDADGFSRAYFNEVVRDWSGISFGAGDVPCTAENKEILLDGCNEFAGLILEAARIEFEAMEVQREAEAKN